MPVEASSLLDICLRLLVAVVLGGLIGLEREFHGRPAGLRTHIMVCLGAAVIMVSAQLFQEYYSPEGAESIYRVDPGRIAAGVVTGIGFLGAGAIIRSRDIVRGLTTAACIWFVAALGIVVGCGLYVPASAAAVIGLLVLTFLDPIGRIVPAVRYDAITIIADSGTAEDIETLARAVLRKYPVHVQNTSITADRKTGDRELIMFIRTRGLGDKHEIMKKLLTLPSVERISWE